MGKPMRWRKVSGQHCLHIDASHDNANVLEMPVAWAQFPSRHCEWVQTSTALHHSCNGRSRQRSPKNMQGHLDPATKRRLLEGQRQYAPWRYNEAAMLSAKSGEMIPIPAELKEQLHHFFPGATRAKGGSPRDRRRLLGNGWHIGVAKFIIYTVFIEHPSPGLPRQGTAVESRTRLVSFRLHVPDCR